MLNGIPNEMKIKSFSFFFLFWIKYNEETWKKYVIIIEVIFSF